MKWKWVSNSSYTQVEALGEYGVSFNYTLLITLTEYKAMAKSEKTEMLFCKRAVGVISAVVLMLGAGAVQAGLVPLTLNGVEVVCDDDYTPVGASGPGLIWMRDANLARTERFGVTDIDFDGEMRWDTAQEWIAAMNAANYGGANTWRQWSALNSDGSGPCASVPGPQECNDSELGHLFFVEGGLKLYDNINDSTALTSMFTNMLDKYWSGTKYTTSFFDRWFFETGQGLQLFESRGLSNYSWPVRTGQCQAITHTLTVNKAGPGFGTVTSNPAGIDCGGDCSEDFTEGNVVALTATAGVDSIFAGWSGDTDCTDGSVTMDADRGCRAWFEFKKGTLIIEKQTTGGDGLFNFTSTIPGRGDFTLTTVNGIDSIAFDNLTAAVYGVHELPTPGWNLTDATCDNGSNPDAVLISPGETVTCRFANTKKDTLIIKKQAIGGDGRFSFSSTLPGIGLGNFDLTTINGVASRSFANLNPGGYTVVENVPDGWQLDRASCDNGDTPDSITLTAGETVTCTFFNLREDTLIIEKQTTGGDGLFNFSSTIPGAGDFTLTTVNGIDSKAFGNLTAGIYSVFESPTPGWDLTDMTCDNGNPPAGIILLAGETVTCRFANTKEDTLILVTKAVGADGNFPYTSTTLSPASFSEQTANGQATRSFSNLTPGTYDLTESTPIGWQLKSARCDNGDDPANITLAAGETVTCTFENLREDTLIIEKQASGADRRFSFSSTIPGIGDGNFDLTTINGVASRSFANINPGDYIVVENVPDGWDLTGATCDNGDTPDNITLGTGETVTCTFANTEQDTITVVKQTTGGDGAFDFTSSQLGDFTLVTSGGTASQRFSNLSPGSYSISETVPDGWELSGATCDNGDDPASITLAAGESVTCTFANTEQDTITVVKQTTGGDGAFDFTSSQLGDFTLVTSGGTASQSFSNLSPGSYSISETVPDGWELSGATCDNGDDPANITLAAGEAVTCTFANIKQDTITVVKQTTGGDGAFDFTSSQLGAFTLVTSAGTASQSFSNLSPGSYSISETVPDGWELSGATCDNGDDPASITLAAGEAVTCTFSNRRVGASIPTSVPTLSPPALALLAILLMTLMAVRMRQRGRR